MMPGALPVQRRLPAPTIAAVGTASPVPPAATLRGDGTCHGGSNPTRAGGRQQRPKGLTVLSQVSQSPESCAGGIGVPGSSGSGALSGLRCSRAWRAPGVRQPAGERRGQTAPARVPAQRRGEGQRCTRRLPQPRCRAGEQLAAGEGRERQDFGGCWPPLPNPAGQRCVGGCCSGREGGCRGEEGSSTEMSSAAALDSLAASLPPASIPRPSQFSPPAAIPSPGHTKRKSRGAGQAGARITEQASSCRGGTGPCRASSNGASAPPKVRGALHSPAG